MIPTRRVFVLAGLGPVLLVVAGGAAWASVTAWAVVGLAVALWVLDGACARTRPALSLERQAPRDLYVGQRHVIEWHVTNRSSFAVEVHLRDEVPRSCVAEPPICRETLPARSVTRLSYRLTAAERGDAAFGGLTYRLRGPLGLAWAQRTVDAGMPVRVLPRLANWKAAEIAERQALIRQAGSHRHRWRGAGTTFETLREYGPEDDIRWIDWKATARLQRPVTRTYEVDRHQTVMILLDASRMMTTYCGHRTKFDAALEGAVLVARTAVHRGDQVGLLVFSDQVDLYLHPRRDRQEVGQYLAKLYARVPRLVEPDYDGALHTATVRNRRRALVILFTDVTDMESARRMATALVALVPRHVPLVVTIADETIRRLEESMPERPEEIYPVGVANELARERDEILERLRTGGVSVLDAAVDDLAIGVIARYLDLKRRIRL
jgi:uncharacterized protein (DUF58 family)